MELDLPLIWAGVIALAVFMYVLMDGFDLGIGILFQAVPTDDERDIMMNSVAPVWDGNETCRWRRGRRCPLTPPPGRP